MSEAYEIMGQPLLQDILIVADHASNHVPDAVKLGIAPELMAEHIAWDIGVDPVSRLMARQDGISAILGGVSRLVVDLNRRADEDAAIPAVSDGIEIAGNGIDAGERAERLRRYHHSYHHAVSQLIADIRPKLLLSLHSFTPSLRNKPDEKRPWEIGILYNEDDRAARIAIPLLRDAGLDVGDQLPYSGKLLNATMDRHGEGTGTPYLGVEMRQDLVGDTAGQERFARILVKICQKITEKLGEAPQNQ